MTFFVWNNRPKYALTQKKKGMHWRNLLRRKTKKRSHAHACTSKKDLYFLSACICAMLQGRPLARPKYRSLSRRSLCVRVAPIILASNPSSDRPAHSDRPIQTVQRTHACMHATKPETTTRPHVDFIHQPVRWIVVARHVRFHLYTRILWWEWSEEMSMQRLTRGVWMVDDQRESEGTTTILFYVCVTSDSCCDLANEY